MPEAILAYAAATTLSVPTLFQIFIFRKMFVLRRGTFEYQFLSDALEHAFRDVVYETYGDLAVSDYRSSGMNRWSTCRRDLCDKILKDERITENDASLRIVLLKAADLAWIDNHTEDEVRYLSQAVTLKPNDFVGKYRLGIALEHEGKKEKAVQSYEASLKDASISENLKKFISYHLGYLKSKGCRKRQENAGLRYTMY